MTFYKDNSIFIVLYTAIINIRLAQLGKTMQDQYGPEICHTWHYKKLCELKKKSKMSWFYFAHELGRLCKKYQFHRITEMEALMLLNCFN